MLTHTRTHMRARVRAHTYTHASWREHVYVCIHRSVYHRTCFCASRAASNSASSACKIASWSFSLNVRFSVVLQEADHWKPQWAFTQEGVPLAATRLGISRLTSSKVLYGNAASNVNEHTTRADGSIPGAEKWAFALCCHRHGRHAELQDWATGFYM